MVNTLQKTGVKRSGRRVVIGSPGCSPSVTTTPGRHPEDYRRRGPLSPDSTPDRVRPGGRRGRECYPTTESTGFGFPPPGLPTSKLASGQETGVGPGPDTVSSHHGVGCGDRDGRSSVPGPTFPRSETDRRHQKPPPVHPGRPSNATRVPCLPRVRATEGMCPFCLVGPRLSGEKLEHK